MQIHFSVLKSGPIENFYFNRKAGWYFALENTELQVGYKAGNLRAYNAIINGPLTPK